MPIHAQPHAKNPELLMVADLVIQKNSPADNSVAESNFVTQEPIAGCGVQDVQGFAIADGDHCVQPFACVPQVVSPAGKARDKFSPFIARIAHSASAL